MQTQHVCVSLASVSAAPCSIHSMLSFKKTHFSAFFAEPLVFLAFERTLGRFLKIGPLPCRSSATLVFFFKIKISQPTLVVFLASILTLIFLRGAKK